VLDPAVLPHVAPQDLLVLRPADPTTGALGGGQNRDDPAVKSAVELHTPSGLGAMKRIQVLPPSTVASACVAQVTKLGSTRGHFALSLAQSIADAHGLKNKQQVWVHAAHPRQFLADFAEISIRDQFISRSGLWRVLAHLSGRILHVGQTVNAGGVRVYIRGLRHYVSPDDPVCPSGEKGVEGGSVQLTSGIVHHGTKLALRSRSASVVLAMQLTREMWDYADDGELYLEKAVHRFVGSLAARWGGIVASHSVTVLLFSRTFFDYDTELLQWLGVQRRSEEGGVTPPSTPSHSGAAMAASLAESTLPQCLPLHFPLPPVQTSTAALHRAEQSPFITPPPDSGDSAHTDATAEAQQLLAALAQGGEAEDACPPGCALELYADVIRGERALVLGSRGQVQEDLYHVALRDCTLSDWSALVPLLVQAVRQFVLAAKWGIPRRWRSLQRRLLHRLAKVVRLLRLLGLPLEPGVMDTLTQHGGSGAAKTARQSAVARALASPTAVLHPGALGVTADDTQRLGAEAAALATAARFSGQGVPSSSHEGNILEAINLALNHFAQRTREPSLAQMGQHIITVSPGTGHYQVNFHLSQLTKRRIMGAGVGCDLVNMTRPPLYLTPLFVFTRNPLAPAPAAVSFGPEPHPNSGTASSPAISKQTSTSSLASMLQPGILTPAAAKLTPRHAPPQSPAGPRARGAGGYGDMGGIGDTEDPVVRARRNRRQVRMLKKRLGTAEVSELQSALSSRMAYHRPYWLHVSFYGPQCDTRAPQVIKDAGGGEHGAADGGAKDAAPGGAFGSRVSKPPAEVVARGLHLSSWTTSSLLVSDLQGLCSVLQGGDKGSWGRPAAGQSAGALPDALAALDAERTQKASPLQEGGVGALSTRPRHPPGNFFPLPSSRLLSLYAPRLTPAGHEIPTALMSILAWYRRTGAAVGRAVLPQASRLRHAQLAPHHGPLRGSGEAHASSGGGHGSAEGGGMASNGPADSAAADTDAENTDGGAPVARTAAARKGCAVSRGDLLLADDRDADEDTMDVSLAAIAYRHEMYDDSTGTTGGPAYRVYTGGYGGVLDMAPSAISGGGIETEGATVRSHLRRTPSLLSIASTAVSEGEGGDTPLADDGSRAVLIGVAAAQDATRRAVRNSDLVVAVSSLSGVNVVSTDALAVLKSRLGRRGLPGTATSGMSRATSSNTTTQRHDSQGSAMGSSIHTPGTMPIAGSALSIPSLGGGAQTVKGGSALMRQAEPFTSITSTGSGVGAASGRPAAARHQRREMSSPSFDGASPDPEHSANSTQNINASLQKAFAADKAPRLGRVGNGGGGFIVVEGRMTGVTVMGPPGVPSHRDLLPWNKTLQRLVRTAPHADTRVSEAGGERDTGEGAAGESVLDLPPGSYALGRHTSSAGAALAALAGTEAAVLMAARTRSLTAAGGAGGGSTPTFDADMLASIAARNATAATSNAAWSSSLHYPAAVYARCAAHDSKVFCKHSRSSNKEQSRGAQAFPTRQNTGTSASVTRTNTMVPSFSQAVLGTPLIQSQSAGEPRAAAPVTGRSRANSNASQNSIASSNLYLPSSNAAMGLSWAGGGQMVGGASAVRIPFISGGTGVMDAMPGIGLRKSSSTTGVAAVVGGGLSSGHAPPERSATLGSPSQQLTLNAASQHAMDMLRSVTSQPQRSPFLHSVNEQQEANQAVSNLTAHYSRTLQGLMHDVEVRVPPNESCSNAAPDGSVPTVLHAIEVMGGAGGSQMRMSITLPTAATDGALALSTRSASDLILDDDSGGGSPLFEVGLDQDGEEEGGGAGGLSLQTAASGTSAGARSVAGTISGEESASPMASQPHSAVAVRLEASQSVAGRRRRARSEAEVRPEVDMGVAAMGVGMPVSINGFTGVQPRNRADIAEMRSRGGYLSAATPGQPPRQPHQKRHTPMSPLALSTAGGGMVVSELSLPPTERSSLVSRSMGAGSSVGHLKAVAEDSSPESARIRSASPPPPGTGLAEGSTRNQSTSRSLGPSVGPHERSPTRPGVGTTLLSTLQARGGGSKGGRTPSYAPRVTLPVNMPTPTALPTAVAGTGGALVVHGSLGGNGGPLHTGIPIHRTMSNPVMSQRGRGGSDYSTGGIDSSIPTRLPPVSRLPASGRDGRMSDGEDGSDSGSASDGGKAPNELSTAFDPAFERQLRGIRTFLTQFVVNPFRKRGTAATDWAASANRRRWTHALAELPAGQRTSAGDRKDKTGVAAGNPFKIREMRGDGPTGFDPWEESCGAGPPSWRSLCEPAILPLTTDFVPSATDIRNNFSNSLYTLSPGMGGDGDAMSVQQLLQALETGASTAGEGKTAPTSPVMLPAGGLTTPRGFGRKGGQWGSSVRRGLGVPTESKGVPTESRTTAGPGPADDAPVMAQLLSASPAAQALRWLRGVQGALFWGPGSMPSVLALAGEGGDDAGQSGGGRMLGGGASRRDMPMSHVAIVRAMVELRLACDFQFVVPEEDRVALPGEQGGEGGFRSGGFSRHRQTSSVLRGSRLKAGLGTAGGGLDIAALRAAPGPPLSTQGGAGGLGTGNTLTRLRELEHGEEGGSTETLFHMTLGHAMHDIMFNHQTRSVEVRVYFRKWDWRGTADWTQQAAAMVASLGVRRPIAAPPSQDYDLALDDTGTAYDELAQKSLHGASRGMKASPSAAALVGLGSPATAGRKGGAGTLDAQGSNDSVPYTFLLWSPAARSCVPNKAVFRPTTGGANGDWAPVTTAGAGGLDGASRGALNWNSIDSLLCGTHDGSKKGIRYTRMHFTLLPQGAAAPTGGAAGEKTAGLPDAPALLSSSSTGDGLTAAAQRGQGLDMQRLWTFLFGGASSLQYTEGWAADRGLAPARRGGASSRLNPSSTKNSNFGSLHSVPGWEPTDPIGNKQFVGFLGGQGAPGAGGAPLRWLAGEGTGVLARVPLRTPQAGAGGYSSSPGGDVSAPLWEDSQLPAAVSNLLNWVDVRAPRSYRHGSAYCVSIEWVTAFPPAVRSWVAALRRRARQCGFVLAQVPAAVVRPQSQLRAVAPSLPLRRCHNPWEAMGSGGVEGTPRPLSSMWRGHGLGAVLPWASTPLTPPCGPFLLHLARRLGQSALEVHTEMALRRDLEAGGRRLRGAGGDATSPSPLHATAARVVLHMSRGFLQQAYLKTGVSRPMDCVLVIPLKPLAPPLPSSLTERAEAGLLGGGTRVATAVPPPHSHAAGSTRPRGNSDPTTDASGSSLLVSPSKVHARGLVIARPQDGPGSKKPREAPGVRGGLVADPSSLQTARSDLLARFQEGTAVQAASASAPPSKQSLAPSLGPWEGRQHRAWKRQDVCSLSLRNAASVWRGLQDWWRPSTAGPSRLQLLLEARLVRDFGYLPDSVHPQGFHSARLFGGVAGGQSDDPDTATHAGAQWRVGPPWVPAGWDHGGLLLPHPSQYGEGWCRQYIHRGRGGGDSDRSTPLALPAAACVVRFTARGVVWFQSGLYETNSADSGHTASRADTRSDAKAGGGGQAHVPRGRQGVAHAAGVGDVSVSPSATHLAAVADCAVGLSVAFEVLADLIADALTLAETRSAGSLGMAGTGHSLQVA